MAAELVLPPGWSMPRRERSVTDVPRDEMRILAQFHRVGQKYGFAVVCQRCDQSLQGTNASAGHVFSVTCGCREYRTTFSDPSSMAS